MAAALGAPKLGLEPLAERRTVVEARLAVALDLLLDELHEARVVERDGRGVREEIETFLEVHRPFLVAAPRAHGEDADELAVVREGHGSRADERGAGSPRVAREERGALGGPGDGERLVEERADDRVARLFEGDGAPHLVAHVGAPTGSDPRGLR